MLGAGRRETNWPAVTLVRGPRVAIEERSFSSIPQGNSFTVHESCAETHPEPQAAGMAPAHRCHGDQHDTDGIDKVRLSRALLLINGETYRGRDLCLGRSRDCSPLTWSRSLHPGECGPNGLCWRREPF
jgi:hypothetical protein